MFSFSFREIVTRPSSGAENMQIDDHRYVGVKPAKVKKTLGMKFVLVFESCYIFVR